MRRERERGRCQPTSDRLPFARRNVRLRKGFVNAERAPFGGLKLRIPTLLFVEKMRTQSRFNVRLLRAVCVRQSSCVY